MNTKIYYEGSFTNFCLQVRVHEETTAMAGKWTGF